MGLLKSIALLSTAILPLTSSTILPRVLNDPANLYLTRMCFPLYSNHTRSVNLGLTIDQQISSLAFSPFPCEQELYLEATCIANGTQEIDFLAEQECLCGGNFFEVALACNACYLAHGYQNITIEKASSGIASLSTAECAPTPPFQPFSNLAPAVNITSLSLRPSITLGTDRFPNATAVSNYFTGTGLATPGTITGSATARQTSWTNFDGVLFTPTSIPPNSGTGTARGSSTTSSTTSSKTSSSIGSASTNVAVKGKVQVASGMLAAGLGVVALL